MDDFPTKNRRRAWRRAMKKKVKNKMRKIAKYVWKHSEEECQRDMWFADTRKKCDCWMCKNRRDLEGATISEKRNQQSFKEQFAETE
jgi:hypothetical protein